MGGIEHLVLASKEVNSSYKNVHFVSFVEQAIVKAQELGFNKLLVIGGSKTNESFINSGQISKLFLDIHPLSLGNGKKLFDDFNPTLQFKLLSFKAYPEGFVHIEYQLGN